MKVHYIYRIFNSETKQFYIGLRTSKCEALLDTKYMGSSSVWNRTYIKENKHLLTKEILCIVETRKLLKLKEIEIMKPFENDPLCINKLFKVIPYHLGVKQSPEHIEKRKMFGEANGMYGKHHSDETKAKIALAQKGKKLSEERKLQISRVHKGKIVKQNTKDKLSKKYKTKFENGYISLSNKAIIVEDLLEDTTKEYVSNVEFCKLYNLNSQSVGVYIRKGFVYKKRFKIQYK